VQAFKKDFIQLFKKQKFGGLQADLAWENRGLIIFAQRIPRHEMLARNLKKHPEAAAAIQQILLNIDANLSKSAFPPEG